MITLKDLRKEYPGRSGTVVALDGINMHIPRGAIHGVVGQSGAGKSTLIRCLTALEQPTSGQVMIDGVDLSELKAKDLRHERRSIGMVFQHANLLDSRTAAQNIAYPLAIAGVPRGQRHERVQELLELVGLGGRGDAYPAQLSGGQRQRVGIARALADNPPVLLCDEPTSALDSETTVQILALIARLREQLNVTVLVITHEMAVVRRICDSVTLLEAGRVVQSGSLGEVMTDPDASLARELVPLPTVPEDVLAQAGTTIVDVSFTSKPGEPTGARVFELVAGMGADVAAGLFETMGATQVGRLALALSDTEVAGALSTLRAAGLNAQVRGVQA